MFGIVWLHGDEEALAPSGVFDLSCEVIEIAGLNAGDTKFIDDGEKESNGADGGKGLGVIGAKESSSGSE